MSKLAGRIVSTPRALSDFRAVSDVSNNLDRCEDMLRKLSSNLGYTGDQTEPEALLSFLTEKFTKVLGMLQREENEHKKLESEVITLRRQLSQQITHNQRLIKQRAQNIMGSQEEELNESERYVEEINRKNREIIDLQTQIENQYEQIERQKEKSQKLQETLELFKNEVRAATTDRQEYRQKYKIALEDKNASDLQLHSALAEKRKVLSENRELNTKVTQLEKLVSVKDRDMLNLRDQLKDNVLKNSKFMKEIQQLNKQNAKQKADLTSKETRLNTLRTINQKFEAKSQQILKKCEGLTELNQKYHAVLVENQQMKQDLIAQEIKVKENLTQSKLAAVGKIDEVLLKEKEKELERMKELNVLLNSKYLEVSERLAIVEKKQSQARLSHSSAKKSRVEEMKSSEEVNNLLTFSEEKEGIKESEILRNKTLSPAELERMLQMKPQELKLRDQDDGDVLLQQVLAEEEDEEGND